jgi:hypothetical protein
MYLRARTAFNGEAPLQYSNTHQVADQAILAAATHVLICPISWQLKCNYQLNKNQMLARMRWCTQSQLAMLCASCACCQLTLMQLEMAMAVLGKDLAQTLWGWRLGRKMADSGPDRPVPPLVIE